MKPCSRSIADCQDSSKQLANSLLSDLFFVTKTLNILFALVKFISLWQSSVMFSFFLFCELLTYALKYLCLGFMFNKSIF